MSIILPHEQDTLKFGAKLALLCPNECIIFLEGRLGAGKTTLVRGFLRGLGFMGKVKSPTYSLVENYTCGNKTILHFDLYRLQDPRELEYIGIRDHLSSEAIWLVEWPDKGHNPDNPNQPFLPNADLKISLRLQEETRLMQVTAFTPKGDSMLTNISRVNNTVERIT